METATFVKPVQITAKKLSKFTKIITHVNDTQPYKIFCSSSTSFVRYKNNKFLTNYLLRIIISSTCVIFLVNLDDFFVVIYTDFHENYGIHSICSLSKKTLACADSCKREDISSTK